LMMNLIDIPRRFGDPNTLIGGAAMQPRHHDVGLSPSIRACCMED
jgi:hypothetical protein